MSTKLNVGMIGVGNFGAWRRKMMRETGLFSILACCDRNPEFLRKACEEESARGVSSFAELLDTPGIEGVVISTGIDTHAPMAIAAMERGLHVFVEKPLCGTLEEVAQLREAADRSTSILTMGHHDNATDWINTLARHYIDTGKLGTVVSYEENATHSGGLAIRPGDWRGRRERNPGGMLMQCGVHSLHHINYLFGPIHQVAAMMRYDANPDTETADVSNVLLRHENGIVGTLNCYHVTAYCHEFRIFGTKGNLYIDTFARRAWYQESLRGPIETRVEVSIPESNAQSDQANLINWYRAIREGATPSPTLEDGIAAILPVLAAEIADREGRQVQLSELQVSRTPRRRLASITR